MFSKLSSAAVPLLRGSGHCALRRHSVRHSRATRAATLHTAALRAAVQTNARQSSQADSAASSSVPSSHVLGPHDVFAPRHLGPSDPAELSAMLKVIGYDSLGSLIDATVPAHIRSKQPLSLPPQGETEALHDFKDMMAANALYRSYIGLGYYDTLTPPVILRNIIENPAWYTPYTPYQAEIAQGRLEMLLNYQTMVSDLTGLPVSNSSLLDEGTAAAEAMNMCFNASSKKKRVFLCSADVHPQTVAVLQTRAKGVDVVVKVQQETDFDVTAGQPRPAAHSTAHTTPHPLQRRTVNLTQPATASQANTARCLRDEESNVSFA